VKVSHAAVKSFDRRGVSCKNARTVQFSGGGEKCPVTRTVSAPKDNIRRHVVTVDIVKHFIILVETLFV